MKIDNETINSEKTYEENLNMHREPIPEFSFKVVFAGNSMVGKTSLINYELQNKFSENYKSTLVSENKSKNYETNRKIIRLCIWDTCGGEVNKIILQNFFKSALCIFLVFTLDNEDTFKSLNKYISMIVNLQEKPILFLIGNKCDIKEKKIPDIDIKNFCSENKIDFFFEVSAKNGKNVHELFDTAVKQLYLKFVEPICFDTESSITKDTFYLTNLTKDYSMCGTKSCCNIQ